MAGANPIGRRVLIVVSAYCPAMIADMHRARMLAWELPDRGWDVEILTPGSNEVRRDVIEPRPTEFFATGTPIHAVGSMARAAFEAAGSRTHAWRTLLPLRRSGNELLRSKRFDLVYFSTTTLLYWSLGPSWKRKFGIPFVLDIHDPIQDLDGRKPATSLLSRVAQSRVIEAEMKAIDDAAGMVAVSPVYVSTLRERCEGSAAEWMAPHRHAVIPFAARDDDLAEARNDSRVGAELRAREIVLSYVGAGGDIMLRSFGLICRALAALRQRRSALVNRVRIELFGTVYDWKPGQEKELEAVAKRAGIAEWVTEDPERISYRRSLVQLLESDGALVLGVDDQGYMPSKLFTLALSGKPLLASLRRDGPAYAQFESIRELGHALWFDRDGEMPIDEAQSIVEKYLTEAAEHRTFDRRAAIEPMLSPNMADRHAKLFDACAQGAIANALRAPHRDSSRSDHPGSAR